MTIKNIEELTDEMCKQVDRLLHQLDPDAPAISMERMQRLMNEGNFTLFTAEDGSGKIAGMLTLTVCPTLSRNKYWIEDVIVDNAYRGKGKGRELVRAAISHVRKSEENAVIYLTSNPSRTSARRLYRSEGFEEYETGVFRLKI